MESWDLLCDLVIVESSDDIIASDMDINNPWHARARAWFKWYPVVAYNRFSIDDKTSSDQVAVAVNLIVGIMTTEAMGRDDGLWLLSRAKRIS